MYKNHTGCSFLAADKSHIGSYQLLNQEGRAVVTIDFQDGERQRFLAADSVPADEVNKFAEWANLENKKNAAALGK